MAAIEAECYKEYNDIQIEKATARAAYAQYQASLHALKAHNNMALDALEDKEPSDAEVVADFASYETTWKDKWKRIWTL